jgi:hypothetical protein
MPLISTMPALPLIANYTVEWVAIDPASGADVANVTVTNPALYGIDLSGNVPLSDLPPEQPPLLPALESENLFAPVPTP